MSKIVKTSPSPLATLLALYSIHSPSRKETNLLDFISVRLAEIGVDCEKDKYGQIYHVSLGQPLLCAHTDQVQKQSPSRSAIKVEGEIISAPNFGLGADDKNGVWIILEVIERCVRDKKPVPSFIFSVEEETCSGRATECFKEHFAELEVPTPFALVLDRRNGGDIIGTGNGYCSEEFENLVSCYGKPFGYEPTIGAYSDANGLSRFLNVVNLSVGYHNPHTTEEYTVISELENALNFTLRLLEADAAISLASCRFEEKKDFFWDFEPQLKKKKKPFAHLDAIYLLPREKRYLYNLLSERLNVVYRKLEECWMDDAEELEKENEMIEAIMEELWR